MCLRQFPALRFPGLKRGKCSKHVTKSAVRKPKSSRDSARVDSLAEPIKPSCVQVDVLLRPNAETVLNSRSRGFNVFTSRQPHHWLGRILLTTLSHLSRTTV